MGQLRTVKGWSLVRTDRGEGGNSALTPAIATSEATSVATTTTAGKLQCDTAIAKINSIQEGKTQGRGCTRPDPCVPAQRPHKAQRPKPRVRSPYEYPTTGEVARWIELHRKLPVTRIAELTGYSRTTIRRHLIHKQVYTPRRVGGPTLEEILEFEIGMAEAQQGKRRS